MQKTEQRLSFINDCYTSGLFVYAWCREKEIAPSTFYSWIHHLKNRIPITGYRSGKPVKETHKIVKVDIVEENTFIKSAPKSLYQEPKTISESSMSSIRIQAQR